MKKSIELKKPIFTISLDYELMWGVFDKKSISTYGENVEGVHKVIPKMLKLFTDYGIHVTWASVGSLFYKDLEKLKHEWPAVIPTYNENKLSAFAHANTITESTFLTYYSGINNIELIKTSPGQEVATHTFSHYYCLEAGQTVEQFQHDLQKAILVAKNNGINIKSIVFPRNQYSHEYLKVCKDEGIVAFRGNESNFLQRPRSQNKLNLFIRFIRLMDTYINISGSNTYSYLEMYDDEPLNIPASFFLRPFNPKLKFLEPLKIRRLKKAMLKAAENKQLFHMWWHPHNFGANSDYNLNQLKSILEYHAVLRKTYDVQNLNMSEIFNHLL